jgi:SAM-dependent methyltransferase
MRTLAGIGLISALVLLFQVTLTRLFSIAQFYHFVFLVVSLALLGFGASGSLLAAWPHLRQRCWQTVYALVFGPATVAAYIILNHWAFDSYAIAWDRGQVWRLLGNLLALAVPFTLAGALIGAVLSDPDRSVGYVYGANMIGSAAGAAVAPILLDRVGDARVIMLCSVLAGSTAILLTTGGAHERVFQVVGAAIAAVSFFGMIDPPGALTIQPSPYKPLSYFQRNPDATLAAPVYNPYSRLDVVYSNTIHSAPGLSMTYFGELPPEIGLLIDGDNLMPAPQAAAITPAFAAAMPAALALNPSEADVLVLGLGGGLDVQVALALGAETVTAVEPNSLIIDVMRGDLRQWTGLANDPRVTIVHQELRTYARQTDRRFDVVQLALNDAYRPVTSGAFTLTENYVYTVEGFEAFLDLLREDGVFVVTRWLQNPPSEDLRTLGLIIAALEHQGGDPARQIVAFRTFQTVTFLVKRVAFSPAELDRIVTQAGERAFDMVLPPGVPSDSVNRYATIETPVYHDTYVELVTAADRAAFYADYAFQVSPPTDNHPFFFHFFKWRQTPEVLDNLGRTWQPFGGSGFFVLIALLLFAVLASILFIVLPIGLRGRFRAALRQTRRARSVRVMVYFGSLGLAFLLVEVTTIQQFILLLGQPTLAIAVVLATLLLFSGIGSVLSIRLPWGRALLALVILLVVWPWILDGVSQSVLLLPLAVRLGVSVVIIAPLGLLMGVPFARGLTAIRDMPDLIPWAWAINGGASVVSAVVAVLLALSFGFNWVLWAGGAFYAVAWLTRPSRA